MDKRITKRIVFIAVFIALGYALSFLEIPMFLPFLKLDFSNTATMLGGFLLGPFSAVVIEGAKQLLCFLTKSTTGGVGELANFIVTVSYVLPGSILYIFKKGRGSAILGLSLGVVTQTGAALLSNRFILFPLFSLGAEYFAEVWFLIAIFNIIKAVSIAIITFLLYKQLSKASKRLFG